MLSRRSGRISRLPLVMVVVAGERYLVPMLGEEVNWVRNVTTAGATSPYVMVEVSGCAWKKLLRITGHPC